MPFAGASPVTNLSRTDRRWLCHVLDISRNDMVTLTALFPWPASYPIARPRRFKQPFPGH